MSKQCPTCNATIEDTATVCPFCGAQQSAGTAWENSSFAAEPAPVADGSTGNRYASTAKVLTIILAVYCFLSAAGTLFLAGLAFVASRLMEWAGFFDEYAEAMAAEVEAVLNTFLPLLVALCVVDVIFYIVFGILLLVKKNWKIALTITIYSGFWFLLGQFGTSMFRIPALTLIGIFCTIWLYKQEKTNV